VTSREVKFDTVPNRTRAIVRSGYVAANSIAMGPPSDAPKTMARSEPTASITERTSSIRTSRLGSRLSGTRSDKPTPRLSNRMRREHDERRCRYLARLGSSHIASMFDVHPITNTRSTGPSPVTWYAMCTPSAVLA